jgi:integrase
VYFLEDDDNDTALFERLQEQVLKNCPNPERVGCPPIWIKQGINAWMTAAQIEDGRLLRPVSKSGKILRDELGDWAIWSVVEQSSKQIGIEHFGAHDQRRTCAKLCRKSGGDLEQIKFLLGHSSIQTTERYLGSEQEIVVAVNDDLGL